ncbi:hypothetical protein Q9Q99_15675 [Curtobacterium flaccumfaciens]|nr:hypothetical protein Q9Q99_15675 [Curtobacterium flaccumfaciens]
MPDFADFFRRRDDAAPDLIAIDGTDRFLIDEAPHVHGDALRQPGEVAVVDDRHGVLTLGLITQYGASDIRVVQDSLVGSAHSRPTPAPSDSVGSTTPTRSRLRSATSGWSCCGCRSRTTDWTRSPAPSPGSPRPTSCCSAAATSST